MQEIIHVIDDEQKLLDMVKLDLEIMADEHLISDEDAEKMQMTAEDKANHDELYNLYKKWSRNPALFLSKLS